MLPHPPMIVAEASYGNQSTPDYHVRVHIPGISTARDGLVRYIQNRLDEILDLWGFDILHQNDRPKTEVHTGLYTQDTNSHFRWRESQLHPGSVIFCHRHFSASETLTMVFALTISPWGKKSLTRLMSDAARASMISFNRR